MRRIDSFTGQIITGYNILAIRSELVSVGRSLVPERLWKALGAMSVLVHELDGNPFYPATFYQSYRKTSGFIDRASGLLINWS
jgi:hypothetical protein